MTIGRTKNIKDFLRRALALFLVWVMYMPNSVSQYLGTAPMVAEAAEMFSEDNLEVNFFRRPGENIASRTQTVNLNSGWELVGVPTIEYKPGRTGADEASSTFDFLEIQRIDGNDRAFTAIVSKDVENDEDVFGSAVLTVTAENMTTHAIKSEYVTVNYRQIVPIPNGNPRTYNGQEQEGLNPAQKKVDDVLAIDYKSGVYTAKDSGSYSFSIRLRNTNRFVWGMSNYEIKKLAELTVDLEGSNAINWAINPASGYGDFIPQFSRVTDCTNAASNNGSFRVRKDNADYTVEYRRYLSDRADDDDSGWIKITEKEGLEGIQENLRAGEYEVRYAADDNHLTHGKSSMDKTLDSSQKQKAVIKPFRPQDARVIIEGTAQYGVRLVAKVVTGSGSIVEFNNALDYTWYRKPAGEIAYEASPIQVGTSYTPTSADVGATLMVVVTAKNPEMLDLTLMHEAEVDHAETEEVLKTNGPAMTRIELLSHINDYVDNARDTDASVYFYNSSTYTYEYSKSELFPDGDTYYVVLNENKWTVTEPGTYYVRIVGDAGHEPSNSVSVTIKTIRHIVFDGNDGGISPLAVLRTTEGIVEGTDEELGRLERPVDPTRAGYVFDDWYKEPECNTVYDFNSPVTDAFTLYAKWIYAPFDDSFYPVIEPVKTSHNITQDITKVRYGDVLQIMLPKGFNLNRLNDSDVIHFQWTRGRNGDTYEEEIDPSEGGTGTKSVSELKAATDTTGKRLLGTYTLRYEDLLEENVSCYIYSEMEAASGNVEDCKKQSSFVHYIGKAVIELKTDMVTAKPSREYIPDDVSVDRLELLAAASPAQGSQLKNGDPDIKITFREATDEDEDVFKDGSGVKMEYKTPYAGTNKNIYVTFYDTKTGESPLDVFIEWNEDNGLTYFPGKVYDVKMKNQNDFMPKGDITETEQSFTWREAYGNPSVPEDGVAWTGEDGKILWVPKQMPLNKKELLEMVIEEWVPGAALGNADSIILEMTAAPDSGYIWDGSNGMTSNVTGSTVTFSIKADPFSVNYDDDMEYGAFAGGDEFKFKVRTTRIGIQCLSFDESIFSDDYDDALTLVKNYIDTITNADYINNGNSFLVPVSYFNSNGFTYTSGSDVPWPLDLHNKIEWESSNPGVAAVVNVDTKLPGGKKLIGGSVTLMGIGTTTITARVRYSDTDGLLNSKGEKADEVASYVLIVTATEVPPPPGDPEDTAYYLPKVADLVYNGTEQTGVSAAAGYEDYYILSGVTKAVNAGTYRAIATLKTGYCWRVGTRVGQTRITDRNLRDRINIYWTIKKAPTDKIPSLVGHNPTTDENNDGWIECSDTAETKLMNEMEYNDDYSKVINNWGWTSCTGTRISGLKPGKYYVRYKEKENYQAGEWVEVTIHTIYLVRFETRVSTIDGTVYSSTYPERIKTNSGPVLELYWPDDERLYEPSVVQMPEGWYDMRLFGWMVEDGSFWDFEDPGHFLVKNSVTLTANWVPIDYEITYDYDDALDWEIAAENPLSYNVGSGIISLNDPYRKGYKFMGWTCEQLGLDSPTTGLSFDPQLIGMPDDSGRNHLGPLEFKAYWRPRCAMPEANPAGGEYTASFDVELTCETPGAVIYYTIDGTEPDENKRLYVGSIPIERTTTLKAIAYADGLAESEILVAEYTIRQPGYSSTVRRIIVQPEKMTLIASSSEQLVEATLIPENVKHGDLIWTSGDTDILQVVPGKNGSLQAEITPLKAGKTYVTVREEESGVETRFSVTVAKRGSSAWVPVKAVKISGNTLLMRAGGSTRLSYEVVPSNGTDYIAVWKSSDTSVAVVEADGVVTAVQKGKATITLEIYTYGYQEMVARQECIVTVEGSSLVQGIMIEPKEITLTAPVGSAVTGGTAQLTAVVYPDDAANRTVLWSADKPGYVTIDAHGHVTALKAGEVHITASSADGATDENGKPIYASIRAIITQEVAAADLADYKRNHNDAEPGEEYWIGAIGSCTFTGYGIKPEPNVYFGAKRLTLGEDYKLRYINNIHAREYNEDDAPTVIVEMTGNYTGSVSKAFTIDKADIGEAQMCNSSGFVSSRSNIYEFSEIYLMPKVYWQGKKLKAGRDFTCIPTDQRQGAFIDVGEWTMTVYGNGDFTGTGTALTVLTRKSMAKNLKKVSARMVTKASALVYSGSEIKPEFELEGVDMSKVRVAYRKNVNAGTATVIFSSASKDYYGKKTVKFKIKKRKLKTDDLKIYVDGRSAGYDVAYLKGGAKPEVDLLISTVSGFSSSAYSAGTLAVPVSGNQTYYGNRSTDGYKSLVPEKDHTLKYKVYARQGYAIVKGKGNYKGKVIIPYSIHVQDINNLHLVIDDVNHSKKAGKYKKVKISVYDLNGKKLKKNKDFYVPKDGWLPENETPAINSTVNVEIKGKGMYNGSINASFRVIDKSQRINKASVSFRKYENGGWISYSAGDFGMSYTGAPVTLTNENVVLVKNEVAIPQAYLKVVGIINNTKSGTATMFVKAIGNEYGGLKKIKFRINKR